MRVNSPVVGGECGDASCVLPQGDKARARQRTVNWRLGVGIAATYAGLVLAFGLVGPEPAAGRRIYAIAGLLATAVVSATDQAIRCAGARSSLLVCLCVVDIACLTAAPLQAGLIVHAVITARLLRDHALGIASAILVCTLLSETEYSANALASLGSVISTSVRSLWISRSVETPQDGPSSVNLQMLALAAVFLCAGARSRPVWITLSSLGLLGSILVLQEPLADLLHKNLSTFATHSHDRPLFWLGPVTATVCCSVVLLGWSAPAVALRSQASGLRVRWWPALLVLGVLSDVPHRLWVLGGSTRRIAILNYGGFDWKRPWIGTSETGMFGMLPVYMESRGWTVDTVDLESLEDCLNGRTQVLVVINCPHRWNEHERGVIREFQQRGGSVLVLGDHTNVFGLMDGLNSLTSDWGIRFNFDSACKEGQEWGSVATCNTRALGMWMDPYTSGIGVGASLAVVPPAVAVFTANYAFSDRGSEWNTAGAMLGDYKHSGGERLGDIPLVAAAHVGRGLGVVYGDTSGFQNTALPQTFNDHIAPLLGRLSRPQPTCVGYLYGLGYVLLVLAASGLSVWRRRVEAPSRYCEPFLAGMAMSMALAQLCLPPGESLELGTKRLVVDRGSFPDVGHYRAHWNWISPLTLAAFRTGMIVEEVDDVWTATTRVTDTIALIAPRKGLSNATQQEMIGLMESGATVIAAVSSTSAQNIQVLCSAAGVMCAPGVLGPVPPVKASDHGDDKAPRFVCASALSVNGCVPTEIVYRYGASDIVVAARMGRGWFIVIGDERFFSSDNTEGLVATWPANMRLACDMLLQYAGGVPVTQGGWFDAPRR